VALFVSFEVEVGSKQEDIVACLARLYISRRAGELTISRSVLPARRILLPMVETLALDETLLVMLVAKLVGLPLHDVPLAQRTVRMAYRLLAKRE